MTKNPNIQDYNEQFISALEMLNESQKKAVDTIEGPVLVIAGPGTGKTHILTARIGKILLETDAQAHNILCLTFTEAGVQAMRQRLLEFIGPEAHRVHIFTFHSFCNSIIQDNLELFGRHDLEPVSELEKVEIMQEILDELPVSNPLRRGRGSDLYFYSGHLADLFQRMKAEDWETAFLLKKIEKYLTNLPSREDFIYKKNTKKDKKGDLKQAKFDKEKEKMQRLAAAVNLFPDYVKKMKQRRRYDYEDMILWVVKAFDNNEALLRTYQEQYLYFLVDEYQDTNGAQNEILQHLIRYWQNPNVFIVGDDDQSIYEFQGARLKNLTDFYAQYENDLALVVLRENYRSSQNILDAAQGLIQINQKRIVNSLQGLGVDKILKAKHKDFAETEILPSILVYPNNLQEETDIVAQIEKWKKEDFPLDEIAIIYAKHRQVSNLINLLERKKIPYHTKRKVNILDLTLVRRLRTLLEYFSAEYTLPYSGENLFYKILHFDFLGLDVNDLATISLYQAKIKFSEREPWRKLIGNKKLLEKLNLNEPEKLLSIAKLFRELLRDFSNLPVPQLIERLINRTGLLRLILDSLEKTWWLQVMHTFLSFVREETERYPRTSAERLLDILQNMDKNRIALEVQKTNSSQAGVNLLTAHGSKGLEFQKVFLLDCIADNWEAKRKGNNFRFSFPDTLTLSGETDVEEARRRLFYVALTRAKEALTISFSSTNKKGKEQSKAIFVDEILQNKSLEVVPTEADEKQLLEAQMLLLVEAEETKMSLPDAQTLNHLLEGFQLSVSAMNQYLRCPIAFYYENVLRVPVVQSEAASYGTAMHNSLQRIFERMVVHEKKEFPSLKEFLDIFNFEMQNYRGYFQEKKYKQSLQRGIEHLANYYKTYARTWVKKVQIEKSISTEMNGVPIKGVIDRLDLIGNEKARIVDYKTGSQASKKIQTPTKSEPNGGTYWRQLIFYKILFENHQNTPIEVISGEISYLEANNRGEYESKKIVYKSDDIRLVKAMMKETYMNIMEHKFEEGCEDESCSWCQFVKEQKEVSSFADWEVEGLDD